MTFDVNPVRKFNLENQGNELLTKKGKPRKVGFVFIVKDSKGDEKLYFRPKMQFIKTLKKTLEDKYFN